MIDFEQKQQYDMADLVKIVAALRNPDGGCPWDLKQTHHSIRQNMIEETYEVVEAIDLDDPELLREELGDVLLQVVFHSQMEKEAGRFDFDAVCDEVCKKLIYRHPHVFGDKTAATADTALENWEAMKNREKGRDTAADRLDSVPASLPALMRAAKTQKRAAAYGFRPENTQQTLDRLDACVKALRNEPQNRADAVGEMLFAAVFAARALDTEPEEALCTATKRFAKRVKSCEALAAQDGKLLEQLDKEALASYWNSEKH